MNWINRFSCCRWDEWRTPWLLFLMIPLKCCFTVQRCFLIGRWLCEAALIGGWAMSLFANERETDRMSETGNERKREHDSSLLHYTEKWNHVGDQKRWGSHSSCLSIIYFIMVTNTITSCAICATYMNNNCAHTFLFPLGSLIIFDLIK